MTNLARLIGSTAMVLCAADALAGPDAMDAAEARHLLARTGFGASPDEISAFVGKSYTEAVAEIVGGSRTAPSIPMPIWTTGWHYPTDLIFALGQTEQELFFANRYLEFEDLAGWWLAEMVATPSPLTERLVLFWHDHFATSYGNAENPRWMADQNRLFRTHAAGDFAALADAILRDPAMLEFLSNTENSKEAPNENLGREFLELFTLGQGRGYTEKDVKEAARALTGHSIGAFDGGRYAFYAEDHDAGTKTILGQTGRFGADDLTDIVTADANFGPYIVEKLWLHFVSDVPDPTEITRLVEVWKSNELQMKPLLEALFLTDAFWSVENRGRLVKSPIELLVGTVRTLGLDGIDTGQMIWAAEEMGQMPFMPPNVGGWPSGTAWVTDASAVSRATLMAEALETDRAGYARDPMMAGKSSPAITAGPSDLRVGQVFAIDGEAGREDGQPFRGAFLTLFDVSFGGETFRSLPFYVEQFGREAPEVSIFVGDCEPGCLFGAEFETEDGDAWVWLPMDAEMADYYDDVTPKARAFLGALAGHMPTLLASTTEQLLWTEAPEEDFSPPTYRQMKRVARQVAQAGQDIFGSPTGNLVQGASQPEKLGLAGLDQVSSLADIDAMFEDYDGTPGRPTAPPFVYASISDWMAALPDGATAEDVLLPITLMSRPMPEGDARAQVEALITAPEFQLN
ncbi:DUF1800 domain-containing protein [Shimia ponticola]|uniref:DUF1800 domain-containing protein n=1 Tax=Shimia ponticola TaxID=2582893 RepID=UPI0011BDF0B1|nr:DUF1800 domain-containing protein [Shimia ponticola]